ncbi:MAG: ABC transporter permease [Chloroflexi bacterium]|nr:ABC transporter permease [Chloroflexota bacterium]
MLMYVVRRLLMLIPILLGVTLLTFAIVQVTPGDPVALMLGPAATPERVAAMRQQLGFDDPVLVQYGRYVWNALHGDLGRSVRGQTPVLGEILARFPSTVELTVAAMLLAVIGGVGAGVIAATSRRRVIETATMIVALVGLSLPSFWLAIILILVFGVNLRWVSVAGGEGLKNLILPAFCLALAPAAVLARLTRSSILEVIREDYVRTARAKGLGQRAVVLIHVLRNSLIPVVTVIGLQFAGMLGGAVFIENVFARPGIGRFAVNAIAARDYPQVQGVVLFTAAIYVLINLAVDLMYGWLDPRIRYD